MRWPRRGAWHFDGRMCTVKWHDVADETLRAVLTRPGSAGRPQRRRDRRQPAIPPEPRKLAAARNRRSVGHFDHQRLPAGPYRVGAGGWTKRHCRGCLGRRQSDDPVASPNPAITACGSPMRRWWSPSRRSAAGAVADAMPRPGMGSGRPALYSLRRDRAMGALAILAGWRISLATPRTARRRRGRDQPSACPILLPPRTGLAPTLHPAARLLNVLHATAGSCLGPRRRRLEGAGPGRLASRHAAAAWML